jgi:hypothetical protein
MAQVRYNNLPALADGSSVAGMEAWLQQQLGAEARVADFLQYLERRSFGDGQVIYRQGEAADANVSTNGCFPRGRMAALGWEADARGSKGALD